MDNASVKFHNLDIAIRRIKAIGGGAPKYMNEVLNRVMHEDIWPRWIANISLQDHSLADLANLGHPYSTRFDVDSFIHPDSEVHKQSGSLVENSHIVSTITPGGCSVKLTNTSPHYIFLRYGTRYMRMRDPAGETMRQALPYVKRRLTEEIKAAVIKITTSA